MPRERRSGASGLWALVIVSAIQGLTPDARSLASPWSLDRVDELVVRAGSADPDPGHTSAPGRLGDSDPDEPSSVAGIVGRSQDSSAIGRRRAPVPLFGHVLEPDRAGPIAAPSRSIDGNFHLAPGTRRPALAVLCRMTC